MKKGNIVSLIVKLAIVAVILGAFSTVFVFDPFKLNLNFLGKKLTIEKTANVITEIKKISEFTTACYFEDKIIQEKKYKYTEKKINVKEERQKNVNTVKESAKSSWSKLKESTNTAVDKAKQSSGSGLKNVASAVGHAAKDIVVATGSSAKDIAVNSAPAIKEMVAADEIQIDSTEIGKIIFIVTTKARAGFDFSKIAEDDIMISGDTLKVKLPPVEVFDIIANPSDWRIFHREGDWEDDEIRSIQSRAKDVIREDAIACGILEKAEACGRGELVSLFKSFGFKEVLLF